MTKSGSIRPEVKDKYFEGQKPLLITGMRQWRIASREEERTPSSLPYSLLAIRYSPSQLSSPSRTNGRHISTSANPAAGVSIAEAPFMPEM
jgi:hypothetical protein